jgi:hypothetical protein
MPVACQPPCDIQLTGWLTFYQHQLGALSGLQLCQLVTVVLTHKDAEVLFLLTQHMFWHPLHAPPVQVPVP